MKFYEDIGGQSRREQQEYNKMINEMQKMDEIDLEQRNEMKDPDTIELFPIGHFQFRKTYRKDVFRILNISESAWDTFENIWDEIRAIPIANINCNPITEEGYGNVMRSNDIEVWRNIYRIRKEFFQRKFHRIDLK